MRTIHDFLSRVLISKEYQTVTIRPLTVDQAVWLARRLIESHVTEKLYK